MPHRMVSEELKQITLNEIFKMLVSGVSDPEIQQELKIPKSTYYRYKQQLHQEAVQNIKSQRLDDYALFLDTYQGRLKKILHHILLRISDTSRISNRDLSTLSQVAREISAELLNCDSQRYHVIYPDKKELPGKPALIQDPDYDDSEGGAISTDINPIV